MMKLPNHIQAVIFDLDGVICFTDHYHYQAWKQLADNHGWQFDEQINHQLRGVPRLESLNIILKHNDVELPETQKQALTDWKNDAYKALLSQVGEDDLYPDVVALIDRLKRREIKLAVGSASKNAEFVLNKLGILDKFDAVMTGNDVINSKPDPEIFLKAAQQLAVEPENCLVFEDAESGVEAALRAQMQVVGVGECDSLPNAPAVIRDYNTIGFAD